MENVAVSIYMYLYQCNLFAVTQAIKILLNLRKNIAKKFVFDPNNIFRILFLFYLTN